MESTTNMEKSNYDILVDKIEHFYASKKQLKNEVNERKDDFNQLKEHIGDWNFRCSFPLLEAELNGMIKNWNIATPLSKLLETLGSFKKKIEITDKAIVDISKEQQTLLKLPDRYNRKTVTDKIAIFLKNVPNVQLSAIDEVNGNIIPKINTMIENVKEEFSKEDIKVEKNRQTARKLKKLISTYDSYVGRFNLKQLCVVAGKLADQVLQTPNMAHSEIDADRLAKANQQLGQCIKQFKAENDRFKDLLSSMENDYKSIWKEDYDVIEAILTKGAFHDATPATQLQAQIESAKNMKRKSIDQALMKYSNKIKDLFYSDIRDLYDESHSKDDLRYLIGRMDRKVAEDTRKRIILIAEIVAGLTALIVIIATGIWPYVLAAAIIIGIIIAYFHFRD